MKKGFTSCIESQSLTIWANREQFYSTHVENRRFDLAGERPDPNQLVQGELLVVLTSFCISPMRRGNSGVAFLRAFGGLECTSLVDGLQPDRSSYGSYILHGLVWYVGIIRPVVSNDALFIQSLGDLHGLVRVPFQGVAGCLLKGGRDEGRGWVALGLAVFTGLDDDITCAGDESGQVGILNVRKVFAREIRYRLPVCIPGGALIHIHKVQTHTEVVDYLKVADLALAQNHQVYGRRLHAACRGGLAHQSA